MEVWFFFTVMNLRTVTVFCRYMYSADFVNIDIKSWKQTGYDSQELRTRGSPPPWVRLPIQGCDAPWKYVLYEMSTLQIVTGRFREFSRNLTQVIKAYVHHYVRGLDVHQSFSLPLAAQSLCHTLAPVLHGRPPPGVYTVSVTEQHARAGFHVCSPRYT